MAWIPNDIVYKEILKSIESRKDKRKYKKLIKKYRKNIKKQNNFEKLANLYCQYQRENFNDLREIEHKYNLDFFEIREEIRKEVDKDVIS